MRAIPILILFAALLLLVPIAAWAGHDAGSSCALTFADEFHGGPLDASKWSTLPRWGHGGGNGELNAWGPDAFEFKRYGRTRFVRLVASQEPLAGYPYTSGAIHSDGKFAQLYGRFELRGRLPDGAGLWPAWWLLPPNAWPPEIDIMENLGQDTHKLHFTLHYQDNAGQHQTTGGTYSGADYSTGWHTFALDWLPGLLVWYVDGVERFRVTENVPDQPMFLFASLAVGGWAGPPPPSTAFPAYYDIDYIRVWGCGE